MMKSNGLRRLAVLTSGGDAPGLNACIRAVVRTAFYHGLEIFGIRDGYEGMIRGDFIPLDASSVSNIIQRGGTILKSSRSEAFRTKEGRIEANIKLRENGASGVILIGGDGSFAAAAAFISEHKDVPWVGIPKTIDNDLSGTDICIGYDTALNTAIQAIDKIRDTAESHNRIFIVEVMGMDSGFIAYGAGIGSGAEIMLIPETQADVQHLKEVLAKGWTRPKSSLIIIVAEGDESGGAEALKNEIRKIYPNHYIGTCILGHIQRGGSPTCADRILASRLGIAAVEAMIEERQNVMVGMMQNQIVFTPIQEIKKHHLDINNEILRQFAILST